MTPMCVRSEESSKICPKTIAVALSEYLLAEHARLLVNNKQNKRIAKQLKR